MTAVIVHLLAVMLLCALRALGRIRVDATMLVVAVFLPIAGPVAVVALAIDDARGMSGARTGDIASDDLSMRKEVGEGMLGTETSGDEAERVLPIEDALLVGDASIRREAMISFLLRDSGGNMRPLSIARGSHDTEASHYASTAMSRMSGSYEARLNELTEEHYADPDDMGKLSELVEFLDGYLSSGLLEGTMRKNVRYLYESMLAEQHVKSETMSGDVRLCGCLIDDGDYDQAEVLLDMMESQWPDSQEVMCVRLRYCASTHDLNGTNDVIGRMRDIRGTKTPQVRDALDFWDGSNG